MLIFALTTRKEIDSSITKLKFCCGYYVREIANGFKSVGGNVFPSMWRKRR